MPGSRCGVDRRILVDSVKYLLECRRMDTVAEIRAFNRFYTRWVGALDRHHLGSSFSLAEARVLYEVAHNPGLIARDIIRQLGLDPGYLSRMVKRFEADGLVRRETARDARAASLYLTDAGAAMFTELDRKAAERIREATGDLDEQERTRLAAAMGVVTRLTSKQAPKEERPGLVLREPRPGDYGWAVERHGVIYDAEFGWGPRFEGLVAELFGKFAICHNPVRERCWIAELNGERVGCVFVVEREPKVAQLRCLLVEPKARGKGVGAKLVDQCISFARSAGYERMMLWTNKGLDSARRIYEAAGFKLVEQQRHEDFGVPLIGQSWEMAL
jgi:DNA-binding MarR family transcriptional regulator/N-acetylglutamate synthase-like GNAT family acetyltransferase